MIINLNNKKEEAQIKEAKNLLRCHGFSQSVLIPTHFDYTKWHNG